MWNRYYRSSDQLIDLYEACQQGGSVGENRETECEATDRCCHSGFDGVSALDLTGPLETFAAARVDDGETERSRPYQVRLIGVTGKSFTSESDSFTKRDIRSETLFWLIR